MNRLEQIEDTVKWAQQNQARKFYIGAKYLEDIPALLAVVQNVIARLPSYENCPVCWHTRAWRSLQDNAFVGEDHNPDCPLAALLEEVKE